MDYFLFNFSGVQFHYTMSLFTIVFNSLWINCSFNCIMLPDIDSTFFHVLCGNLIVSKGSLYVYLFELNLRNLLYVIANFFTFYFRSTFISFFVSKSIRKRNAFFYVSLLLQRKKEPCLRTTLFYCLLSLSYQWYFSPLLILKAR